MFALTLSAETPSQASLQSLYGSWAMAVVTATLALCRRARGPRFSCGVPLRLRSSYAFFALARSPRPRRFRLRPARSFPSTFQGGDGNQTDSASLTDWQGLAAANRVNHSPDPNVQDTAFVAGSNEDQPVLWDLTTEAGGVNPAKSNILDAWEVSDPLGGDVFVYLAFARESAQLHCPRGHDLPDVRAQPRRAALEQRESGHPLPNDRGRSRLLPGDRERRLGDPAALGHEYVG